MILYFAPNCDDSRCELASCRHTIKLRAEASARHHSPEQATCARRSEAAPFDCKRERRCRRRPTAAARKLDVRTRRSRPHLAAKLQAAARLLCCSSNGRRTIFVGTIGARRRPIEVFERELDRLVLRAAYKHAAAFVVLIGACKRCNRRRASTGEARRANSLLAAS